MLAIAIGVNVAARDGHGRMSITMRMIAKFSLRTKRMASAFWALLVPRGGFGCTIHPTPIVMVMQGTWFWLDGVLISRGAITMTRLPSSVCYAECCSLALARLGFVIHYSTNIPFWPSVLVPPWLLLLMELVELVEYHSAGVGPGSATSVLVSLASESSHGP
jgi:hypothetical protein